jgi:hypothetical protein
MTDNESSRVIELLTEDRKERRKRDSDFRDLLQKNHQAIQSTRDDVQALSTRVAMHEKDDTHMHDALGSRLELLEDRAEATGQHQIVQLEQQLAERDKAAGKWRDRVWSIAATFLTTATIALVAHYLATR